MKHVILAFLTLVWTASPALAQGCHEPKGSTQPQAQGAEPRGLPPAAAGGVSLADPPGRVRGRPRSRSGRTGGWAPGRRGGQSRGSGSG